MNKKLFFGMFAAAGMLFATSCSHEDLIEPESGDTVNVSFVVNTEDALATRTIGDASNVSVLAYVVYNETAGKLVASDKITDYNGSKTLKLALAKGQTYKLGFFACSDALNVLEQENGDFKVLCTSLVNSEMYDAFAANLTYTVSGSDLKTVTLKRIVAQINVGIKQEDFDAADASGIRIGGSQAELKGTFAKEYSVLGGNVLTTREDCDFVIEGIPSHREVLTVNGENYKYLLSVYVWPAEIGVSQTVDAKFTFYGTTTTTNPIVLEDGVSNLPIKSNYRTNIVGNVLTSNVDFEVVVDSDFAGEHNSALWDGSSASAPSQDANGVYHINTAEDFAWIMNQQGTNSLLLGKTVVLDTDIDFAGQTISGIGGEACNFAGTFDGNGHTISNFVIDQSGREYYAGLFN